MPHGSILGSLLFLLYVNDLQNCSESIDTIIFADDTNLFFETENLKALFSTVNKEWSRAYQLFISNKLLV